MNDVVSVILWVSSKFFVMTFTELLKKTAKPPCSHHVNNDRKIYNVITHS
jgi:hypothetical protein